jgi:hypothetical protein
LESVARLAMPLRSFALDFHSGMFVQSYCGDRAHDSGARRGALS